MLRMMDPLYPDIGPELNNGHRGASSNEKARQDAIATARNNSAVADAQAKVTLAVEQRKPAPVVARLKAAVVSKHAAVLGDLLKKLSLNRPSPAFLKAPMGSHKGGINDATPPDMLHQFSLGLLKRAYLKTVEAIRGTTKAKTVVGKLSS